MTICCSFRGCRLLVCLGVLLERRVAIPHSRLCFWCFRSICGRIVCLFVHSHYDYDYDYDYDFDLSFERVLLSFVAPSISPFPTQC